MTYFRRPGCGRRKYPTYFRRPSWGRRKYHTVSSVPRPTKIPFLFSWACRRKSSLAHENRTHFRRSLWPTKITLYFRGPADENSPAHENLGVSCSAHGACPVRPPLCSLARSLSSLPLTRRHSSLYSRHAHEISFLAGAWSLLHCVVMFPCAQPLSLPSPSIAPCSSGKSRPGHVELSAPAR
jgi:hypothetical protein